MTKKKFHLGIEDAQPRNGRPEEAREEIPTHCTQLKTINPLSGALGWYPLQLSEALSRVCFSDSKNFLALESHKMSNRHCRK